MPNTFISLDVPQGDGTGIPVVVGATGRPKTFVLSGTVRPGGRFIVEGSQDGQTWDILVGKDGTQVFFTSGAEGAKTLDCIVQQVRVRSIGHLPTDQPPSITMGAPPANGTNFFGTLDVPTTGSLGAALDLGIETGPLKTFIVRGPVPPGSRYTIQASMDGVKFDEVLLVTSDQQGARSKEVICRFVRVQRNSVGAGPTITVGAEAILEPGGTPDITVSSEREFATDTAAEEILAEYVVPLGAFPLATMALTFAARARIDGGEPPSGSLRVRLGGTAGQPDGDVLVETTDVAGTEQSLVVAGPSIPRPATPGSLIKLTGQALAGSMFVRGFVLWFHNA
jgi:hypothetical protein